jgi:hypothetical protein
MAEVTRHDHGKKLTALKKSNSSDSDILFFAKDQSKSHQGWSKLARQFSEKNSQFFKLKLSADPMGRARPHDSRRASPAYLGREPDQRQRWRSAVMVRGGGRGLGGAGGVRRR